jgi:hypothetical protein
MHGRPSVRRFSLPIFADIAALSEWQRDAGGASPNATSRAFEPLSTGRQEFGPPDNGRCWETLYSFFAQQPNSTSEALAGSRWLFLRTDSSAGAYAGLADGLPEFTLFEWTNLYGLTRRHGVTLLYQIREIS